MSSGRIASGTLIVTVVLSLALPASAQWRTSLSKDEMTGKKRCYAISVATKPVREMGFPYGATTGWLQAGADGETEWAVVGFSESPNLLDTTIEDGYHVIHTRIKWDDEVENVTLIQEWGAKFLHFENDAAAISRMALNRPGIPGDSNS